MYRIVLAFVFSIATASADNLFTDNFLQPVHLNKTIQGWSLALKAGKNEGSGEIQNKGYRMEAPRITYQTSVDDRLFFRATVPWVRATNNKLNTYTIGDPSFFTTLKTAKNTSITFAVTEPAANRPLEPDVVRFMAFFTNHYQSNTIGIAWQAGTEIADRYGSEGQDDILSFAGSITLGTLTTTVLKKQVVDGHWWDITQPIDSPLNRLNITLSLQSKNADRFKIFGGVQMNEGRQWIVGLRLF